MSSIRLLAGPSVGTLISTSPAAPNVTCWPCSAQPPVNHPWFNASKGSISAAGRSSASRIVMDSKKTVCDPDSIVRVTDMVSPAWPDAGVLMPAVRDRVAPGVGVGPGSPAGVGSDGICGSADGVPMGAVVAVGVGSGFSESLIGVPRGSVGTQANVITAAKTEAATAKCVRPGDFMDEACYPPEQILAIYSLTRITP